MFSLVAKTRYTNVRYIYNYTCINISATRCKATQFTGASPIHGALAKIHELQKQFISLFSSAPRCIRQKPTVEKARNLPYGGDRVYRKPHTEKVPEKRFLGGRGDLCGQMHIKKRKKKTLAGIHKCFFRSMRLYTNQSFGSPASPLAISSSDGI